MSLTQSLHVVLYEGAGSEPLSNESRLRAMTALLERGFALTRTTAEVTVRQSSHTTMIVLGQFPETMPSRQEPGAPVHFETIGGMTGLQVAERVEEFRARTNSPKLGD